MRRIFKECEQNSWVSNNGRWNEEKLFNITLKLDGIVGMLVVVVVAAVAVVVAK